jgi:hypothetical protein
MDFLKPSGNILYLPDHKTPFGRLPSIAASADFTADVAMSA